MHLIAKNISVLVLTFNESKHIERCLESLRFISNDIHIVDSFSTDNTVALAKQYEANIYQRGFINYADQFQWGLENCKFVNQWIMRMDADEYLEPALIKEINERVNSIPEDVSGIYLKRKVIFKNKWIRYGGFYPHILMRIWRKGVGSIEQRWMDEHIVLSHGKTITFKENFVDHNLNTMHWWINKHNNYAIREMIDTLNIKYKFLDIDQRLLQNELSQAKRKRWIKEKIYFFTPPGLRAFLYFLYRYFLRLGFLDGYQGFVFHFMQSFWYRLLVDVNVQEVELKLNGEKSKSKLAKILLEDYKVKI